MKKIWMMIALSFLLVLSACGGDSYTRDTSSGSVSDIYFKQYEKMKEKKKTFILVFSKTGCSYCEEYRETVIDPYLENHNVTIYDVNLSTLDGAEEFNRFEKEYPDFEGTPTTVIFEKGKLKEVEAGVLSEKELDGFITKYELDKKSGK